MTYIQARDQEQLGTLEAAIGLFINRYQANPPNPHRQTVILFPGGLGSRLMRADVPYRSGAQGQVFNYSCVWLDCSVLTGAALDLQMQGDIDLDNTFIIADGFVHFALADIKPYDGFIQWCTDRNLDWFVYGWDWRRRPDLSVKFFLNKFLPTFRQRVQAACGADPLQNCTLIGHSFGGMVVKLIMNDPNPLVDQIKRAVTVATPFYGYPGQVHRYFEGEPKLNFEGTERVTRVISSLRGGYVLMFLDKDTYDRDRNALAADPEYPLDNYPSLDASNSAIVADAYDPKTHGKKVRYPKNFGFLSTELAPAKEAYQQVAAPLSAARNQKFFNVRAVKFENGTVVNDTINSVRWSWISKNFKPGTDATPIRDEYVCPGDGVIPAWSARLVTAPAGNVRTLTGDLEHMDLMNAAEVQDELSNILELPQMMMMRRGKPGPARRPSKKKVASAKDTAAFIRGLQAVRTRHRLDSKLDQEQATRRYLAKFNITELRQLMRRAYFDALKTPSQQLGRAPTKTPPRPLGGGYGDKRSGKSPKTPSRNRNQQTD
jgi:pimeloyl-ACP methyl ester carboxylesterase